MHFLQAALHYLQTDLQTPARRSTSIRALHSCGNAPIVFAALILGAGFAPANAQQFNFTATPGLNQTQATMATAMDTACNTLQATPGTNPGQTDLFATCNALGGANGLTVRQDLSILAPDEIATLGTTSVNIFNAQIANVVQRLSVVRGGVGGIGLASFDYDPGDWMLAATDTEGLAIGNSEGGAPNEERLGIFINGAGSSGDREQSINEPGFDFDTQAVTTALIIACSTTSCWARRQATRASTRA